MSRKNKVSVFLGTEEVFLKNKAKIVDVKPDKIVTPIELINRSNHPEEYKYDNETRMISPRAILKLGDRAKLNEKELNKKNLLIKVLKK